MTDSNSLWYETGYWPLIGAIITTIAANGVLVWQTIRGFRFQRIESENARRRDRLVKCLDEWYSPLLALLIANECLYDNFGPPSYAKLEYTECDIAAKRWTSITKSVVLQNNKAIEEILKRSTSQMYEDDSFDEYVRLLLHVVSSNNGDATQTELHKKFKYPASTKNHINNVIIRIKEQLK